MELCLLHLCLRGNGHLLSNSTNEDTARRQPIVPVSPNVETSEGATHSAVRNARSVGITQEEIDHVALLAVSTLGMPAATRAFTWIRDKSEG